MQTSTDRWFAVGRADEADARAAGAAAADEALERDDARLPIVFCSDRYDLDA